MNEFRGTQGRLMKNLKHETCFPPMRHPFIDQLFREWWRGPDARRYFARLVGQENHRLSPLAAPAHVEE